MNHFASWRLNTQQNGIPTGLPANGRAAEGIDPESVRGGPSCRRPYAPVINSSLIPLVPPAGSPQARGSSRFPAHPGAGTDTKRSRIDDAAVNLSLPLPMHHSPAPFDILPALLLMSGSTPESRAPLAIGTCREIHAGACSTHPIPQNNVINISKYTSIFFTMNPLEFKNLSIQIIPVLLQLNYKINNLIDLHGIPVL